MSGKPSPKPSLFAELQRRHVYKVGAMYCVGGWLLVQVVTQVFPVFHVSDAAQRWMVLAVVAGFPVALVLAWLFDLTPEGIVRTPDAPATGETTAAVQARHGVERKLNVVLGVLVLLGLGYFAAERLGWVAAPRQETAPADAAKSIAVLPFDNLSDDKANAYFATGMQDEILTRLAGVSALKVISRTSTEKYSSHPDNLKTVAAELGVATILEGSVQKSGERVRVNVQLIDARADAHLWANTYDRDLKDAFAVESEVSGDIAEALKAKLSPDEQAALGAAPTTNAAAYDLFLRAEHAQHEARDEYDEGAYIRAEALYRQALALDPAFALAHAQLAYCQLNHAWFFSRPPSAEGLSEIEATIARALSLAPELPEAHLASGYDRYWSHHDYAGAAAEFRHVLSLQPSNAYALLGLAALSRRTNDWPQALEEFRRVVDVSPRDSTIISEYALTLAFLHRYAEARELFLHALAIEPLDGRAAIYLFRTELLGRGDVAAARQALAKVPVDNQVLYERLGGDVLALAGHRPYADVFERNFDAALQIWDQLPTDSPDRGRRRLAARVAIQTIAGRRDAARAECEDLRQAQEAELAQHPDNAEALTRLSWAYACLGRGDDALRLAQHNADLLPMGKDAYFGTFYLAGLAQIEAQTGHADAAIAQLRQLLAIPAGGVITTQRLRLDPVWDPLRQDPRFQKLIADGAVQEGHP